MKVQFGTRLDPGLRHRLRIFAAVSGRTVEDVVEKALDCYLPPAPDLVRAAGAVAPEDLLSPGGAR
jgi:hypothetical protein